MDKLGKAFRIAVDNIGNHAANQGVELYRGERQGWEDRYARSCDADVVCSFAGAADAAPRKRAVLKAPPPMPEIKRKTNYPSFYLGVHLGGGWSRFSGDASASPSDVIGGLQAGMNQQIDNLVFGAEAESSAARMSGNGGGTVGGTSVTGSAKHDWFATLAGRFGVGSGRTLVYLKGGVAWTE